MPLRGRRSLGPEVGLSSGLTLSWLVGAMALGTLAGVGQTPGPSVRDLGFMAGCWEGSFRARDGAEGVIEEHYTAPSDNLMLGTTRYLLEGRAVQFELTSIREVEGVVSLLPYPGGVASKDAFRLMAVEDGAARFEAPEHDFPRRIIYRLVGQDSLSARADDGTADGQAQEWHLHRVACPG